MSSSKIGPRGTLIAALVASVALVLALPAGSQASKSPKTRVTTDRATHLRGSTALLTGVVDPAGVATSYYFQYGTTTAYGAQTPTVSAGSGETKVPVGQPVSGLTPGVTYDFRIVGLLAGQSTPSLLGHNKTFRAGGTTSSRLLFKLTKPTAPNAWGKSFLISGTLTGVGGANAQIALQASPYPYLEPFVNIGATGFTNAAGAFSFRVSNLAMNTQFRVVTFGSLPVFSQVITEQVEVNLTLHAAATKRPGVVRLYGFVTPAMVGKTVLIQLQKAVRPHGKSENTSRYVTESVTKVKRRGVTFSEFSDIVEIHHTGHYRATLKLAKGAIDSGTSANVTIRETVPRAKHSRRGHKKH